MQKKHLLIAKLFPINKICLYLQDNQKKFLPPSPTFLIDNTVKTLQCLADHLATAYKLVFSLFSIKHVMSWNIHSSAEY